MICGLLMFAKSAAQFGRRFQRAGREKILAIISAVCFTIE